MTLLNNEQIRQFVLDFHMIDPFNEENLNPYGYDATLGTSFKFLKPTLKRGHIIDPRNINPKDWIEFIAEKMVVPPGCFVLGTTVERFCIPNNIEGECIGRSSYSRVGIVPHVTPLEAGWCGYITVEIANNSRYPTLIYANVSIIQILFHRGDMPSISYSTKHKSQYQNQSGVTLTKGL